MSQEGAVKESLTTELDTIKAVFLNDLKFEEIEGANACANIREDGDSVDVNSLIACIFSVDLLPSTADAKMEQFVALTLRFQIPAKYPEEVPKMELKGPRGLSDEKVEKIEAGLKRLAEEKKGNNMLYELIVFVKESLTAYNFPSGKCMICLYEFSKEDVFVKTECFHHFHNYCLAGYMKSVTEKRKKEKEEEKQKGVGMADTASKEDASMMPCPVCRFECHLSSLVAEAQERYPAPALSKAPIAEEKEMLKEAREQQEKFSELFEKQQSQGGIIDDEEEKKRFLIRISDNPQSPKSDTSTDPPPIKSETAATSADKVPGDVVPIQEGASANSEATSLKSSEVNEASPSQNSLHDNDKLSPKCIHVTPKSIDQNQSNNSQSIDLSLLSSKLETLKTDDVDKRTPDHTSRKEADVENPSKDSAQDKASAAQEKSSTEVESKEKTEKADANTAPKQPRGGRRRRQRSRTKSGQAAVKSDTEQAVNDGNQQRNSSRPRRGNYNRQYNQYRPRNRGRRRGRGRGRGGFANDGMASPPYRHNLNDDYGTESSEGRYRQSSYNGEYDRQLNGNRDRPGYYAARVFKPAQTTSRSHQTQNKSEDTVASGSQSNQTDATPSEPAVVGARNGDGNRRGGRRPRYSRNRTRSGRFSEGDYYSENDTAQYGYHNGNQMHSGSKNRQASYGYYYRPPNFQRSYYDQMNGGYYPPYNYYGYNRPSYGYNNYNGYNGYGYGYGGYNRGRGGYGNGRRNNYRQRNRSDTNQSQSSARNEGNTAQKQVAAINPVTSSPGNPTEVSP